MRLFTRTVQSQFLTASADLDPFRNPRQPLRLFTESELRQRLGSLDAHCVAKEIVMSTEELDEHMEADAASTTHSTDRSDRGGASAAVFRELDRKNDEGTMPG